jgi:hypothetical protein
MERTVIMTKYDKLLLRHLKLIEALQKADVQAACDKDGKWLVTDRRWPVMPPRAGFNAADVRKTFEVPTSSLYGEVFSMSRKADPHEALPKNWTLAVRVDGGTLHAVIDGQSYDGQSYVVEYGEGLFHLLAAMCAAIVSAPAKA